MGSNSQGNVLTNVANDGGQVLTNVVQSGGNKADEVRVSTNVPLGKESSLSSTLKYAASTPQTNNTTEKQAQPGSEYRPKASPVYQSYPMYENAFKHPPTTNKPKAPTRGKAQALSENKEVANTAEAVLTNIVSEGSRVLTNRPTNEGTNAQVNVLTNVANNGGQVLTNVILSGRGNQAREYQILASVPQS